MIYIRELSFDNFVTLIHASEHKKIRYSLLKTTDLMYC